MDNFGENSKELSDFFSTISVGKQKRKKELDEAVGDSVDDFFSTISIGKKIVKEKKESLVGDSFEKLFLSELTEENKSKKKKVKKESINDKDTIENPKKETIVEKSLGLLSEPSDVKQQTDPLTPLDQKFATLDDLQKHYNLFLSRIQQQLSSLGGGGEYRFRFLDGLVGIKTNPNNYGNKFLQWNSTTYEAEFVNINAVPTENIVFITGVTTYYQATNENDYIGVSADVPVIIDLPQSPISGKKITVKDEGNKISTYNITVRASVGASVENSNSVIMKVNHESFTYFYNGYNWYIV